jgi:hypothetical protein
LNQACIHRLSPDKSLSDKLLPDSTSVPELRTLRTNIIDTFTTDVPSRYGSGEFYRIIIDTRAAKRSTAGISQFWAFQRLLPGVSIDTTSIGKVTVQFGIGMTSSVGSAIIATPVGDVEFYIMPVNTPFLLSLNDMDTLGIYFNNITNTLVTPKGTVPVV